MFSAIVFDFDGLILDTEQPLYEAWSAVHLAHAGRTLDRQRWVAAIGLANDDMPFDPLADLVAAAAEQGRRIDVEAVEEERRRRRDELIAAVAVNPGVVDWLDRAAEAGIALAVASSSSSQWVEGHLDERGLIDRFDVLACAGGGVLPGKPAPDVYLAACAGLDVDPASALAIEDSPTGTAAAKAAGLTCVAVPSAMTAPLDFSEADLVIESLAAATLHDVHAALSEARRP